MDDAKPKRLQDMTLVERAIAREARAEENELAARRAAEAKRESDEVHEQHERPRTRAECGDGPRPCVWWSCRYHLGLEVSPHTGAIKLTWPDKEPWELEYSCALDLAERGGMTLTEVGAALNVTRERIRQLENRGRRLLRGLKKHLT